MSKPKAVMNWSGGKDSALALHKILKNKNLDVRYLLTSINDRWQRVSMHGVRRDLLRKQAESIGIDLIELRLPDQPSLEVYEKELNKTLDFLCGKDVTHSIFGDIFLEDLRSYRETQLTTKNLKGVFPLWQIPTGDLINEFFQCGFRAATVCVDSLKLDKTFCGRTIDEAFIKELPDDVDVCGENGEFHSFVYDAPFFQDPISFRKGEIITRTYKTESMSSKFYFCDLLPD